MEKTINATEAKTHFGELMKRATEDGQTIIVERSGIPQIAIIPIGEFERMRFASKQKSWEITLLRNPESQKNNPRKTCKRGK